MVNSEKMWAMTHVLEYLGRGHGQEWTAARARIGRTCREGNFFLDSRETAYFRRMWELHEDEVGRVIEEQQEQYLRDAEFGYQMMASVYDD